MQLSLRQLEPLSKGVEICDMHLACELMQNLSDLLMQLLA